MSDTDTDEMQRAPRIRAWLLHKRLLFVLWHLPVIVVGAIRGSQSTGLGLFDVLLLIGLTGIVLHAVAIMRKDEQVALARAVGRGLVVTLVCLVSWFVVFLVGAQFLDYTVAMLGMLAALPLGLFTSGLGIVMRVRPFCP